MIQRCQVSHKPGLVGDRGEFQELHKLVANLNTFTLHTEILAPGSKIGPARTLFTFMLEVTASNLVPGNLKVLIHPYRQMWEQYL